MTVDEYLKKLDDAGVRSVAGSIRRLMQDTFHGTVVIDTNQGHKVCTDEINYYVDQADYEIGTELNVSLFCFEDGIPVYSSPPTFCIAKQNSNGFGYVPEPEWDLQLKACNINPDIIKKIKNFLSSKPPVNY